MAIIATASAVNANSYVTIAESNVYFSATNHISSAQWLAYTDTQKEIGLVTAARQMNSLCYYGVKTTYTQALQFPRTYKSLTPAEIPVEVKYAQMEQALFILKNTASGGESERQKLQAEGVVEFSLGDLSEKYADQAASNTPSPLSPVSVICKSAIRYLSGFIRLTSKDYYRRDATYYNDFNLLESID